jgi:hypothetical protein
MVEKSIKIPMITINDNRDQIKYDANNEIEWIFSPRYGWNEMPKKVINELSEHEFSLDFNDKYYPNWLNREK